MLWEISEQLNYSQELAVSVWYSRQFQIDIKSFGQTNGNHIRLINGRLIAMYLTLAKEQTMFVKI